MRTPSRTNLFLLELILVILFFSLCAAVCTGVFAAAKQTADRSRDLGSAVLLAESAAECFKASSGDLDACAAYLGAARDGDTVTQTFNKDWQPAQAGAAFTLRLRADETEALIRVNDAAGGEVYSLFTRIPKGVAP